MSHFLWIEDFDNSPKATANNVLGSLFDDSYFSEDKRQLRKNLKQHGVFIELSFQDGLSFICQHLYKIDYVILDINLPAISEGDTINDAVLKKLTDFQAYQKQADEKEDEQLLTEKCKELREIAGFYLYTELVVELGFPKDHILFCSNHGEEVKSIKEAFESAKIALPTIYEKSAHEVQEWVKACYDNPYSRLRRGIVEGCNYLKTLTTNTLRFNDFIKEDEKKISLEDLVSYIGVLENFLPLQEPKNKERFYKLFVRTLAHEWEAADPKNLNKQNELFAFSWIMKMSRNWLAHGKVFEQLAAQDVAYLFIVNMRAMFDLGNDLLTYEKNLLSLFTDVVSVEKMLNSIGDNPKKRDYKNPAGRDIPLVENYAALLKKTGNTWQAINFHDALNNLQKNKNKTIESEYLIKGLYQIFWFLTSSGGVYIPQNEDEIKNFPALQYQFKHFKYQNTDYIFELARHIYNRSFSVER